MQRTQSEYRVRFFHWGGQVAECYVFAHSFVEALVQARIYLGKFSYRETAVLKLETH